MEAFIDRLIRQINLKKSHANIGLDPVHENLPESITKYLPESLEGVGEAIVEFNCRIIDAIHDIVPSIKPQIAFYERYGLEGIKAFLKTVEYGKSMGLIVIEDAKRNDIASTASAYSDGHIGRVRLNSTHVPVFDVDAITINPFLGSDGVLPFLNDVRDYSKGVFILVKTSNPSSTEIQDLRIVYNGKEQTLYAIVAQLVNNWGKDFVGESGYSSVGAVVGATFPEEAMLLRKLMPKAYFLVPGYGAQGGKASDVINFFNKDGHGAIISASRSINYAYKSSIKYTDGEYAEAAREAVLEMNKEINRELEKAGLIRW